MKWLIAFSPAARRIVVRITATLLVACCLFCSQEARADDVVRLRDGGRVNGKVMVEDKQSGVSVKLADGTTRRVPSSEVDHVEYGAAPSTGEPPSTTTSAAQTTDGDAARAWPLVKLETGDSRATLDVMESEAVAHGPYVDVHASEWSTVCTVPCNKRLDPNRRYRIGGIPLHSETFTLPANSDQLVVLVEPGSRGKVIAGSLMKLIGIVGAALGGALAVADVAVDSEENPYLPYGLAALGVGIPLTIGGIVLARSGHTEVDVRPRADAGRGPLVLGATVRGLF